MRGSQGLSGQVAKFNLQVPDQVRDIVSGGWFLKNRMTPGVVLCHPQAQAHRDKCTSHMRTNKHDRKHEATTKEFL